MIHQLRVRLPNQPGTLERAVRTLKDAGVDMKALDVHEVGGGERGEVHVIVSDPDRAVTALRTAGHEVERVPALVVEIQDAVGGLHPILKALSDAAVNVQHLYAFVSRVESKSLCVLTVPDVARAEALLRKAGHAVLGPAAVTGEKPATAKDEALGAHLGLDFIW